MFETDLRNRKAHSAIEGAKEKLHNGLYFFKLFGGKQTKRYSA